MRQATRIVEVPARSKPGLTKDVVELFVAERLSVRKLFQATEVLPWSFLLERNLELYCREQKVVGSTINSSVRVGTVEPRDTHWPSQTREQVISASSWLYCAQYMFSDSTHSAAREPFCIRCIESPVRPRSSCGYDGQQSKKIHDMAEASNSQAQKPKLVEELLEAAKQAFDPGSSEQLRHDGRHQYNLLVTRYVTSVFAHSLGYLLCIHN